MCAVINETTKTIRIEHVVTKIVERIVKKEIVTEVPIEKIVTRVETRYVQTGKEVDIQEIVEYVIARIKEYVPSTDIIDVPTEVIVDETTDYITNPPPPNQDKDETTLGGIRDETPTPIPIPPPDEDKDNDETTDPNSEGDGTDEDSNNDGSEDDATDEDSNNDGSEDDATDEDSNNGSTENDETDNGPNNGGSENDETDEDSNNGGTENGDPNGGANNGGTENGDPNGGANNGGTENGDPNGGANNGGTEEGDPNDGSNNGGTEEGDPNDGSNNGSTENDETDNGPNNGGSENDGTDEDSNNDGSEDDATDEDSNNGGTENGDPNGGANNGGTENGDPNGGANNGGTEEGDPNDGSNNGGTENDETDNGPNNGGTENDETDDGSNDGGSEDDRTNGNTNDGGSEDGTPPRSIPPESDPNGGANNGGTENDETDEDSNNGSTENDETDNGANNGGTENDETDEDSNNGSTENDETDEDSNNGSTENDETDEDSNNGDTENNGPDNASDNLGNPSNSLLGPENTGGNPIEVVSTHKLQVKIGPKSVTSRPSIDQPGLDIRITCQVNGNTIHPSINSSILFKGANWKQWGLSVWCEVPSNTNDSDITINVNVSNTERWCGLTPSDVSVSRFVQNPNGSSSSVGSVAAQIELSPNPVPACVIEPQENRAPMFTEAAPTSRSIAENTASGVAIGDPVTATDDDDGDTLTYSLGGTDASTFSIEGTTGQLKTSGLLDYETKSSYSVTVSVSDSNGETDTITVTINVTDVDENRAPMFTEAAPTSRSIAENTAPGVAIGLPVSATDEDNDTLTYSLGGTDGTSFGIDSATGQLKTSAPLNYEDKNSYSVLVTASDNKGGTAEITVAISVTDANDDPVFTEGSSTDRSVGEHTASGVNFGTRISATDEDGDTLTYTIELLVPDAFGIEPTTGQLKTSVALDYKTKNLYWGGVSVSDGNGGTDSITVRIGVTDENDAPMFTEEGPAVRVIIESAESGTNVGDAVSATDEDGDMLEYSLSGTDASSFSIDSASGQLSTSSELADYETKSSYSVTVSVTDNNGGTDSITVNIEVLEFYIPQEEFFDVYYAIYLADDDLKVQAYTIRGYGYDDGTPIYVDNYYKFEGGSSSQTSTGWGSTTTLGTISYHLENTWKEVYSEDDGYEYGSTKVSINEDTTAAAARKMIYQTICNAAHNAGTWTDSAEGISYPEVANNTSDDILDAETIFSYLEDDNCDLDDN